jgi:hypothetical protein
MCAEETLVLAVVALGYVYFRLNKITTATTIMIVTLVQRE